MAWKIVNENSSKALSVRPGSPGEQHPVQEEQNQLWELLPVGPQGSGQFKIRSVATGKVLAIPQDSTELGVQVVQETEGDNPGQIWRFHLVDFGPIFNTAFVYFTFRIAAHSELVLDVRGGSSRSQATFGCSDGLPFMLLVPLSSI
jgi:hypothetical protein